MRLPVASTVVSNELPLINADKKDINVNSINVEPLTFIFKRLTLMHRIFAAFYLVRRLLTLNWEINVEIDL